MKCGQQVIECLSTVCVRVGPILMLFWVVSVSAARLFFGESDCPTARYVFRGSPKECFLNHKTHRRIGPYFSGHGRPHLPFLWHSISSNCALISGQPCAFVGPGTCRLHEAREVVRFMPVASVSGRCNINLKCASKALKNWTSAGGKPNVRQTAAPTPRTETAYSSIELTASSFQQVPRPSIDVTRRKPTRPAISLMPVRGARDVLPEDMRLQKWLFNKWRLSARRFGYSEMETPIVEEARLFERKAGEEMQKQMYTFPSRSGVQLALRPEVTPSVCRLFISHAAALPRPVRWFSIGSCWRYERNARSRRRNFTQWNVDIISSPAQRGEIGQKVYSHVDFGPDTDEESELLAMTVYFFKQLGLTSEDISIHINSSLLLKWLLRRLGVNDSALDSVCLLLDRRSIHNTSLRRLSKLPGGITEEKYRSIVEKLGSVHDIPALEHLIQEMTSSAREKEVHDSPATCLGSSANIVRSGETILRDISAVFRTCKAYGISDWLKLSLLTARGLSYYNGTVWEVRDAQGRLRTIAGGGRYDGLVEKLAGASEVEILSNQPSKETQAHSNKPNVDHKGPLGSFPRAAAGNLLDIGAEEIGVVNFRNNEVPFMSVTDTSKGADLSTKSSILGTDSSRYGESPPLQSPFSLSTGPVRTLSRVSAVGFAMGDVVLLELLKQLGRLPSLPCATTDCVVSCMSSSYRDATVAAATLLRNEAGMNVELELGPLNSEGSAVEEMRLRPMLRRALQRRAAAIVIVQGSSTCVKPLQHGSKEPGYGQTSLHSVEPRQLSFSKGEEGAEATWSNNLRRAICNCVPRISVLRLLDGSIMPMCCNLNPVKSVRMGVKEAASDCSNASRNVMWYQQLRSFLGLDYVGTLSV
eukprot:GHVT01082525.1.p1 GENE.GHVT01082525.1~~GHVT01082525.1.p1  ORF type:complete len:870 (+),score=44.40 GHVT01082525.1:2003-4612(+)